MEFTNLIKLSILRNWQNLSIYTFSTSFCMWYGPLFLILPNTHYLFFFKGILFFIYLSIFYYVLADCKQSLSKQKNLQESQWNVRRMDGWMPVKGHNQRQRELWSQPACTNVSPYDTIQVLNILWVFCFFFFSHTSPSDPETLCMQRDTFTIFTFDHIMPYLI